MSDEPITVAEEAMAAAEAHWGGHMSVEVWDAIGDAFKLVAAKEIVRAEDLSCQGLSMVEIYSFDLEHDNGSLPTFHGDPVLGLHREMARRGEGHVYSCDLIGHRADEKEPVA